jgi:hypothetical protein
MKTYTRYSDIPKNHIYLGSENGDGSIYEELDTAINQANNPVRLLDDGCYSYFDIEE